MSKSPKLAVGPENMLQDARLQAVLQEVQFIRQEILDNITRMHKVEVGVVASFVGLATLAVAADSFMPLLASPFLVLSFFGLWLPKQQHADRSSEYLLEEVEKMKWPQLLGNRPEVDKQSEPEKPWRVLWVGWQHYYDASPPGFWWGCVPVVLVYALGILTHVLVKGDAKPWRGAGGGIS